MLPEIYKNIYWRNMIKNKNIIIIWKCGFYSFPMNLVVSNNLKTLFSVNIHVRRPNRQSGSRIFLENTIFWRFWALFPFEIANKVENLWLLLNVKAKISGIGLIVFAIWHWLSICYCFSSSSFISVEGQKSKSAHTTTGAHRQKMLATNVFHIHCTYCSVFNREPKKPHYPFKQTTLDAF
jgi:hypothetical protein